MDKLRMQSSNGVEDNITKIAQLFPDCVTETVDERSGQPKHLIDFEKLKQNLSDSVMSERAERYQFTWPGVYFKLCQGLFFTFIPTPCWGHAPSREAFSAAKLHNFKSISKFYCQLLRNLSPICQWHSPFLTDVAVS